MQRNHFMMSLAAAGLMAAEAIGCGVCWPIGFPLPPGWSPGVHGVYAIGSARLDRGLAGATDGDRHVAPTQQSTGGRGGVSESPMVGGGSDEPKVSVQNRPLVVHLKTATGEPLFTSNAMPLGAGQGCVCALQLPDLGPDVRVKAVTVGSPDSVIETKQGTVLPPPARGYKVFQRESDQAVVAQVKAFFGAYAKIAPDLDADQRVVVFSFYGEEGYEIPQETFFDVFIEFEVPGSFDTSSLSEEAVGAVGLFMADQGTVRIEPGSVDALNSGAHAMSLEDWIKAGPTSGSMIKFDFGSLKKSPSDIDADGDIDRDDIRLILGAFGRSGATDLDGDGVTGVGDMVVWLESVN